MDTGFSAVNSTPVQLALLLEQRERASLLFFEPYQPIGNDTIEEKMFSRVTLLLIQ